MSDNLDIDVGGWPTISGARVQLYLRPGIERECGRPLVYSFGHVGPGSPEAAWHHRELYLGAVPVDCDPESLRDWLEAHADTILGLESEYRGAEVNVHGNRIGRWGVDHEEIECTLDVQRAIDHGEIACYWDAGDYLSAGSDSDLLEQVAELGLDGAVEHEVAEAHEQGALLREDDVREYLQGLLDDAASAGTP